MKKPSTHRNTLTPISRRKFLKFLAAVASVVACRLTNTSPTRTPTTEVPTTATHLVSPTPTVSDTKTPMPTEVTIESITPAETATATTEPTAEIQPTPTIAALGPRFVVDAHQDIAWNWLEFGRDPTENAIDARLREVGTGVSAIMGQRTTGLPQWLQGRIGVIFATLFVMPQRYAYSGWQSQTYTSSEQAYAKASQQLEAYKGLAAQEPSLQLITTGKELEEVLAMWGEPTDEQTGIVGLVSLMEGADAIREPDEVYEWYEKGLRIVGPSWASTRYAGGTGEPGLLTDSGWQLLAVMAQVGMILDLSHMAEKAYLEAVNAYPGSIIASHSNPRKFLPTDRGLSDEMIQHLAARNGVIGIIPYNRYLKPGWQTGHPRTEITIQTVVEAVDHVVQLTGSSEHVGLGSDFDGGFGLGSIPAEMDTVADLLKIADGLRSWGYSVADIELIMNGNWLRILRNSLP